MSLSARALRALPARAAAQQQQKRALHVSRPARGAHADAGHGAAEEATEEGFSSPIWRNTILVLLGGFAAYRFSNVSSTPHPSLASSSGLSAPGNESEEAGETPLITRYLEYYGPSVEKLKERNNRHLDLVRQRAEDRLFFDSAERPPVHRLRYTGLLDQASQHRQPVGGTVDMSGVRAKSDNE